LRHVKSQDRHAKALQKGWVIAEIHRKGILKEPQITQKQTNQI
jgi:hypothetical protein